VGGASGPRGDAFLTVKNQAHLVFHLRPGRKKALAAAQAEALALLRDLGATAPGDGPLSDRGGLFRIDVPEDLFLWTMQRFPQLGYTSAVDLLEPIPGKPGRSRTDITWNGKPHRLSRLYVEDADAQRQAAPDRRPFLLPAADGGTRLVRGYRGDSSDLGRRALPVCDARLLVNLVRPFGENPRFLDPFAGVGGLLAESVACGYRTFSLDIDPWLRFGLNSLSSGHIIGDTRRLPLRDACLDAVATELPFAESLTGMLEGVLGRLRDAVKPGGRIAVMCAEGQHEELSLAGSQLGLETLLATAVHRKGTECAVTAWQRP
jgi:hypothetical protein